MESRLSFRCDGSLVARVDVARGGVPRERWLRDAVEAAVGGPVPFVTEKRWAGNGAPLVERLDRVPDALAEAVGAAPVPVVRGSEVSPRPAKGACAHRVPAGSFCKRCADEAA